MKCLASTHIYFIWVAQSYPFYQRNCSIVHGEERDTLSEGCSLIKNCGHVRDLVDFQNRVFQFGTCSITTFFFTSFLRGWTVTEGCRVVCLIQARLYQIIVRSFFTVSCPSCGAPLALTQTLASRSDEPRADSLEILPSLLGTIAVFDETEPLLNETTASDRVSRYTDK